MAQHIPNLKFIKSITWNEVFSMWQKEESELPHWVEHYTKRGFNSWAEWRENSLSMLQPERLEWSIYEIIDPLETVPQFKAGPFRAWIKKYYGGKREIAFESLVTIPEVFDGAHVSAIQETFPQNSLLIGLCNNESVTIIEGLHRCCALSAAKIEKIDLHPKIFIACAQFPGEIPLLGQENSPT